MSGFGGKRFLVVALVLIALVLVFVGEFRARQHPSWTSISEERAFARAMLKGDRATGVRPRPNATISFDQKTYTYSPQGNLVDPVEFDPDDPVILVVGDSYALGWGDRLVRSWPKRLAVRLRAADRPARVVNYAVPGANIESHVARVERLVNEWEPTLVIVAHSPDDAAPVANLSSNFALPWVLRTHLSTSAPRNTIDWFRELHAEGSPGWRRVEAAYARLGNFCRSKDLTCVVAALAPSLEGADRLTTLFDRQTHVATRTGLRIVDAAEAIHHEPEQWGLAAGDPRQGEDGHDRIGATITSWIIDENLVPYRPRPPEPEPAVEDEIEDAVKDAQVQVDAPSQAAEDVAPSVVAETGEDTTDQ